MWFPLQPVHYVTNRPMITPITGNSQDFAAATRSTTQNQLADPNKLPGNNLTIFMSMKMQPNIQLNRFQSQGNKKSKGLSKSSWRIPYSLHSQPHVLAWYASRGTVQVVNIEISCCMVRNLSITTFTCCCLSATFLVNSEWRALRASGGSCDCISQNFI